jgi:DNA-binding MarR family transcriptional regulator
MKEREAPEADRELAHDLIDSMSSVRRGVCRRAGAYLEASSLSGAQIQLTRVVRRRPGISVTEAAAELCAAPNTVSTLVRQLVEAGVLQRHSASNDKRVARLILSPYVADGIGAWLEKRSAALACALSSLSGDDRDALAGAVGPLRRLAMALGMTPIGAAAGKSGTGAGKAAGTSLRGRCYGPRLAPDVHRR